MNAALERVSGQQHAPAVLYPGKDPIPILQEAVWAPGAVWMGGKSFPPGFCFVRYDFIQCSKVVYTRDTMETRNLVVMSYCLLCSVVCSLGHCVASWTSILSCSICDVAVRHSYILIVARGFGTWAPACRILHPVLLRAHNELVTFPCLWRKGFDPGPSSP